MRRPITVYSVTVFEGRRFAAFKDAVLLGLSRILARLAGSTWVVTPALQGSPPTLQAAAVMKYPSRTLTFWGHVPEDWKGKTRWDHIKLIETEFTPPFHEPPRYPRISVARHQTRWKNLRIPYLRFFFPMACRSLCGHCLRRVHTTCWIHCRIRKAYYGKLPKVRELKAVWSIAPDMNRHFRRVREAVFKRLTLIMEAVG